jgi:hypothetical protein
MTARLLLLCGVLRERYHVLVVAVWYGMVHTPMPYTYTTVVTPTIPYHIVDVEESRLCVGPVRSWSPPKEKTSR